MHSLTNLNGHGSSEFDLTDNRPARVVFDRVPPMLPLDQILDITSVNVTVDPGINMVEIINYQTSLPKFTASLKTGDANPLIGSSISWSSLSSNLVLTQIGDVYSINGFKSISDWNTAKSFDWSLPADYESFPLWFIECSIEYYDSAIDEHKVLSWEIYDPRFYYISQMQNTTSMITIGRRAHSLESSMNSAFTQISNGEKYYGILPQTLSGQFVINAQVNIDVINLTSKFDISTSPSYKFGLSSNLNSESNLTTLTGYSFEFLDSITEFDASNSSGGGWVAGSTDFGDSSSTGVEAINLSPDGNWAAIGARLADFSSYSNTGIVFIYNLVSDVWTYHSRVIINPLSSVGIGNSVSLSNDANYLVAGGLDNSFIFSRSGTTWTQQFSDTNGSNTRVHINSSGDLAFFGGKVYSRSVSTWSSHSTVAAGGGFSVAINLDGTYFASLGGGGTVNYGVVIYLRTGSTWSLQGTIDLGIKTGGAGDVTINSDGSVVALRLGTSIKVCRRSGTSWSLSSTIDRSTLGFTGDLKLSPNGNLMFVGYNKDEGSGVVGVMDVYTSLGTTWSLDYTIASDVYDGCENFNVTDTNIISSRPVASTGSDYGQVNFFKINRA